MFVYHLFPNEKPTRLKSVSQESELCHSSGFSTGPNLSEMLPQQSAQSLRGHVTSGEHWKLRCLLKTYLFAKFCYCLFVCLLFFSHSTCAKHCKCDAKCTLKVDTVMFVFYDCRLNSCTQTMIFLCFFLQLSVRGKNKKEKLGGFFSRLTKSVDETLLSGQKVSHFCWQ